MPPENLLDPLKEQEQFISNFIPELKAIEKTKELEQNIKVYEGKRGLRALFGKLITVKDVSYFWCDWNKLQSFKI